MGDSAPKHTGPISLTDTPLEPSISRTDCFTIEENPRWKAFFTGDAQAACRGKFCGSKCTPFFHIVKLIAAILRASVRRAMVGRIPLLHPSHIGVVQRTIHVVPLACPSLVVSCQIHPRPWFGTFSGPYPSVPASSCHLLSDPSASENACTLLHVP